MRDKYGTLDINTNYLPVLINQKIIERTFDLARAKNPNFPVLAVVTGTKPDFYKQAPLIMEAAKAGHIYVFESAAPFLLQEPKVFYGQPISR